MPNLESAYSDASASVIDDIREVNLSYLMLAQRMLRENLASGMFRLGMGPDSAEILLSLSPAQMIKLASTNSVLCGFRLDDARLLGALKQNIAGSAPQQSQQQAHMTILMAQHRPAAHAAAEAAHV